jgi:hypothetical protein
MITMLMTMPAVAGKLADGFQGIRFGDVSMIQATQPLPTCSKDPEPGVLWTCPHRLGDVDVTASFFAREESGARDEARGREHEAGVLAFSQALHEAAEKAAKERAAKAADGL